MDLWQSQIQRTSRGQGVMSQVVRSTQAPMSMYAAVVTAQMRKGYRTSPFVALLARRPCTACHAEATAAGSVQLPHHCPTRDQRCTQHGAAMCKN